MNEELTVDERRWIKRYLAYDVATKLLRLYDAALASLALERRTRDRYAEQRDAALARAAQFEEVLAFERSVSATQLDGKRLAQSERDAALARAILAESVLADRTAAFAADYGNLLERETAALARAESLSLPVEAQAVVVDQSHDVRCAALRAQKAAESRLAAATALISKSLDMVGPEFRAVLRAFLSATPAPAATAEPDIDVSDWRVPPKSAEDTLLERIEAALEARVAELEADLTLSRAAAMTHMDTMARARAELESYQKAPGAHRTDFRIKRALELLR